MSNTWKAMLQPESVVIIGASATPGRPGHEIVRNLLANEYGGKIHLVNPKGGEILGLPVTADLESLPDNIDHAIRVDVPIIMIASMAQTIYNAKPLGVQQNMPQAPSSATN